MLQACRVWRWSLEVTESQNQLIIKAGEDLKVPKLNTNPPHSAHWPCPHVAHLHGSGALPGMVSPPPPRGACVTASLLSWRINFWWLLTQYVVLVAGIVAALCNWVKNKSLAVVDFHSHHHSKKQLDQFSKWSDSEIHHCCTTASKCCREKQRDLLKGWLRRHFWN